MPQQRALLRDSALMSWRRHTLHCSVLHVRALLARNYVIFDAPAHQSPMDAVQVMNQHLQIQGGRGTVS